MLTRPAMGCGRNNLFEETHSYKNSVNDHQSSLADGEKALELSLK